MKQQIKIRNDEGTIIGFQVKHHEKMTLMMLIEKAINKLREKYGKEESFIICYSKVTKWYIDAEIKQYLFKSSEPFENLRRLTLNGVEVNEEWPYNNEIVIYDRFNAATNPNLIVKIPLNVQTNQTQG